MESLQKMSAQRWRELVGENAGVVLEVGCHEGDDTMTLLDAFPHANIHCWEPDWRPRNRFVKAMRANERVFLRCHAIADFDGWADWYASHGVVPDDVEIDGITADVRKDWDASGSIMVPTGHEGHPCWLHFSKESAVPVERLDSWLAEFGDPQNIKTIDLIWADVQAAEVKMIRGGQNVLRHTRFLYLEVYDKSLTPWIDGPDRLYQDQPYCKDLVESLPGWSLVSFHNNDSLLFANNGYEPRV